MITQKIIDMSQAMPVYYDLSIRGMEPATKGSYKPVNGRRSDGSLVTRLLPMNKNEKKWRKYVATKIHADSQAPYIKGDYAITITEIFYLPRPKSVRPRSRIHPNVYPDLDKLQRCLHDALTDSGIIDDDSRIITVNASKYYVDDPTDAGVTAQITWHTNREA